LFTVDLLLLKFTAELLPKQQMATSHRSRQAQQVLLERAFDTYHLLVVVANTTCRTGPAG